MYQHERECGVIRFSRTNLGSQNIVACCTYVIILVTYLSSLWFESHKAKTKFPHSSWFFASCSASFHVYPMLFSPLSHTPVCLLCSSLPPSPLHCPFQCCFEVVPVFFLSTCQIHLYLQISLPILVVMTHKVSPIKFTK